MAEPPDPARTELSIDDTAIADTPHAPVASELVVVDPTHYSDRKLLSQGGMGLIVRAFDRRLNRVVALKELRKPSDALRVRFEREVRLTAQLEHPSIVTVHEAGRWPSGEPFYAMRLVPGRSLDELLRDATTLSARLAYLPHVIAVADALAYAHGQGVIHRDLKPGNVMVGEFGETVVIDWGLAKRLDRRRQSSNVIVADSGPQMTEAGDVLGTPAYMPVEQAAGAVVDERADVYAIGAILYHVLSGDVPYGRCDSQTTLVRLLDGPPPPIDDREPRVPRDLAAIVAKATARDPGARYRSARELAEDLHRYQTGRLVAAHRYSPWGRAWRWARRHRALLAGSAAAIAIGAAVILFMQFGEADKSLRAAEQDARAKANALHQTELERADAQQRAAATEAERRKAEQEVHAKSAEVVESREELQAKNAMLEATLREATAARERADRATREAEKSAADARAANEQLQQALDRERARVKVLEDKKKGLSTTLE